MVVTWENKVSVILTYDLKVACLTYCIVLHSAKTTQTPREKKDRDFDEKSKIKS